MKKLTKTLLTATLILGLPLGAYAASEAVPTGQPGAMMDCPMDGSGMKGGKHHGGRHDKMADAVVQINDLGTQIATAAEEQSRVTEEINRNMVTIRDMVNLLVDNGQNTEQSSATLLESNRQLVALVHRFKV